MRDGLPPCGSRRHCWVYPVYGLAVATLTLVLAVIVHTTPVSASLSSRARLGLLLLSVCAVLAAFLRWARAL